MFCSDFDVSWHSSAQPQPSHAPEAPDPEIDADSAASSDSSGAMRLPNAFNVVRPFFTQVTGKMTTMTMKLPMMPMKLTMMQLQQPSKNTQGMVVLITGAIAGAQHMPSRALDVQQRLNSFSRMVAPCCNKEYWCRHCHNDAEESVEAMRRVPPTAHTIDRYAVKEARPRRLRFFAPFLT